MGSSLNHNNNNNNHQRNLSSSGAAFGSEEAPIELSQLVTSGRGSGSSGGRRDDQTIVPPPRCGSQNLGSSLLGGSKNGFGGSSGIVGSSLYSAFGGNSVVEAPELKFLESCENIPPPPQPEAQHHQQPQHQNSSSINRNMSVAAAATVGPFSSPRNQHLHHSEGPEASGMLGGIPADRSMLSDVPSLATHPPRYPTHNSASTSTTLGRMSIPTTHYSSHPGGRRLREHTLAKGGSSSGTPHPQNSFGQMSEVSGMLSNYGQNHHASTEDVFSGGGGSQDVEGRNTTTSDTIHTRRSSPSSPTTEDGRQQLFEESTTRRQQQEQQRQLADDADGKRPNDWTQGGGSRIIQMAMTAAPRDNDGSGTHTSGPLADLDDEEGATYPAAASTGGEEGIPLDGPVTTSFGSSPEAPEDPFMSALSGLDDIPFPFITRK